MESKAKLLGHAIHPVLIVFPLGLLSTSVIFDVVYLIWGNSSIANAAFWMLSAGIAGGFLAAPFGWIDWFAIPQNTRAKSVGLIHGLANVFGLILFIGSWWFRYENSMGILPYIFSFGGVLIALVAGWFGGELVERLGVSVDDNANLNAPNSLTNK